MSLDPVETNPDHYKVVFENERVRVLEYTDRPGERTTPPNPSAHRRSRCAALRVITTRARVRALAVFPAERPK